MTTIAIITRYNLRTSYSGDRDPLSPAWLASRRPLFERYCAPYVHDQTDQGFTWFVGLDSDTPADEERWLKSVAPKATIVRATSHGEAIGRIRNLLGTPAESLVTARLDSDDTLDLDYVARLRHEARQVAAEVDRKRRGRVICFANGCEHAVGGDRWFDRHYPNNPFIALVEPPNQERYSTVMEHAHYDQSQHFDVLTVCNDRPMWCIRVHDDNVSNSIKGKPRADGAPGNFLRSWVTGR
jgi:hypothetical protein